MTLERYPAVEDLGSQEYLRYLLMTAFYIVMVDMFGGEDWVRRLIAQAKAEATDIDGVLVMYDYIYMFWVSVEAFDPEIHSMVREITSAHMN